MGIIEAFGRILGRSSAVGDVVERDLRSELAPDILTLKQPLREPHDGPSHIALDSVADRDALKALLLPLISRDTSTPAGNIQILGLSDLRRRLGDNWGHYRTAVHQTVDRILNHELDRNDRYARIGEDAYLIAFGSADSGAASATTLRLANEIERKLVGEASSSVVSVHGVGGHVHLNDEDDVVFRSDDMPAHPASLDTRTDMIPTGSSGDEEENGDPVYRERLERALRNAEAVHKKRVGGVSFEFAPVWDAHHEVVSTYSLVPVRKLRGGGVLTEHNVLEDGATDEQLGRLDEEALAEAIAMMAELYENEFAVFLNVRFHYRSLANAASRQNIFEICKRVPEFLRKYLVAQIVGIPHDAPPSVVGTRLGQLRPYFRMLVVRAPAIDVPPTSYLSFGVQSVSYVLPAAGNLKPALARLEAYSKECLSRSAFLTVEQVADRTTAKALVGAKAYFLSGPLIGGLQTTPDNMLRRKLRDFRG